MTLSTFNICMLLGWLMTLAGGVLVSPGWGLAVGGVLLIALTLIVARIAGVALPAEGKG